MLNAILPSPLRFHVRKLPKVIAKPLHRAAIEPRPKRRLAQRHTSHPRQRLIVVGDPRHHMNMWVDVVHSCSSVVNCQLQGHHRGATLNFFCHSSSYSREKIICTCSARSLDCSSKALSASRSR